MCCYRRWRSVLGGGPAALAVWAPRGTWPYRRRIVKEFLTV